ncbi:hypothetical protein [Roseomonas sp. KE2513]|uniref:hypothetical protein n=1 Tax=Roseomonas sp. KE2513 TaxID=2479202 RepID=UPI0018E01D76|nr:hypothetical protein [Roseomonas sp. KE2513]
MFHHPPTVPRTAEAGCLAEFRRWQHETQRLREGADAEPLNAAQSARLLREAQAADRRAYDRLEAVQEH